MKEFKIKSNWNTDLIKRILGPVQGFSDDTYGSLKNNVLLLLNYFRMYDVPKNLSLHHSVMFKGLMTFIIELHLNPCSFLNAPFNYFEILLHHNINILHHNVIILLHHSVIILLNHYVTLLHHYVTLMNHNVILLHHYVSLLYHNVNLPHHNVIHAAAS